MSDISLSDDQLFALDKIQDWLQNPRGQFSLGGYAGTGKTTLLKLILPDMERHNVRFAAPTGKAAQVLVSKGIPATTIHRLIYQYKGNRIEDDGTEQPIFEDEGTWGKTSNGNNRTPGLLVFDESSMINEVQYRDIMARRLPVLWVGDHGQLAPVGGDPGIMKNLDVKLENIHRQAQGNPILELAHSVRKGMIPSRRFNDDSNRAKVGEISDNKKLIKYILDKNITQVICGTNSLRHKLNKLYREALGRKATMEEGERVICLSNDYNYHVFNGQIFRATGLNYMDPLYDCSLHEETLSGWRQRPGRFRLQEVSLGNPKYTSEDRIEGSLHFDYGYAVTAHKSQGSEWDRVLVVWENCLPFNMSRWGYTAITRASEHVSVVLR